MVIGTAKKPRVFRRQSGQALGFDYHNNSKAWMTSQLFFDWLHRFDSHIGLTSGREVILLVDNCSAHGSDQTVPSLDHVKVKFLPPNTTCKLQPLDAGIIAAVKMRYRFFHMDRALDLIDEDVRRIYRVHILTAMREVKRIWSDLNPNIIFNSWVHTKLVGGSSFNTQEVQEAFSREEESRVRDVMDRLVPPQAQMSIENIVDMGGEEEHCQQMNDAELIEEIISGEGIEGDTSGDDDQCSADTEVPLPSRKETLKALSIVRRYAFSRNELTTSANRFIRSLQTDLRREELGAQRQSSIEDYFTVPTPIQEL